MADAAKVIRIELRVRGSASRGGGDSTSKSKKRGNKKLLEQSGMTMPSNLSFGSAKQQLAAAGIITAASQLLSTGFSIAETLSYNSEEKTDLMMLDLTKKALSGTIVATSYMLGGVAGAAVGMAVNEFMVKPWTTGQQINIQRNMDQTRATNRFYQTNFAGKGTYTFDYASGSYINSDLEKVRKGSFYKKGSVI